MFLASSTSSPRSPRSPSLVCTPCGPIAGALGGAFGLAAYLTQQDGSPDVIGPQVTSAATKLGGDLFDRYQRVSAYFTTEAKIIMSDCTKMTEVATAVRQRAEVEARCDPDSAEQIRIATKQADLPGADPRRLPVSSTTSGSRPGHQSEPFNDARQWHCKGDARGHLLSASTCSRRPAPTPR